MVFEEPLILNQQWKPGNPGSAISEGSWGGANQLCQRGKGSRGLASFLSHSPGPEDAAGSGGKSSHTDNGSRMASQLRGPEATGSGGFPILVCGWLPLKPTIRPGEKAQQL